MTMPTDTLAEREDNRHLRAAARLEVVRHHILTQLATSRDRATLDLLLDLLNVVDRPTPASTGVDNPVNNRPASITPSLAGS